MLKVYAYENSCGDKGVIIAESKEKAEEIYHEKYPDWKIVTPESGEYDSYDIKGAYLFEVGKVEENTLYNAFPW